MPLTLPLSLEVGSKLVFLLLLPTSTLAEWKRNRRIVENEWGRYGLTQTPISGPIGRFDGGNGRQRGEWDGGFGVVQTFDSNLTLGRKKKKKKDTYPSKSPLFNLKNVFPVICFSLTNAMISHVTWSETSPDLITEVHGCCCCIWRCQPVPSTASTLLNNHSIPPSAPRDLSHFHLSPHRSIASHERGLQCSSNFSRYWELKGQCMRWMEGRWS